MEKISRRSFIKAASWGTLSLSFCGCNGSMRQRTNGTSAKPNIIFIMTDDMGYGDASCYNPNSRIRTPNIDKLAAEGIRFTDAHSPSAVCTPTRYGVLTGRYCWRSRLKRGVFGGFNRPLIETGRMTVASFLKQHGYHTACIGKWHLGMDWTLKEGVEPDEQDQETVDYSQSIVNGPNEVGFNYFFGTAGCTTDDPPLCFIEKATKRKVPFFVYLPLSVPHIPWLAHEDFKGKSGAGPRGNQVLMADKIVGQISRKLSELKIAENTLLIFTSDNGPRQGIYGHESAGKLRGYKGGIWEGGHRVPFIAKWPKRIKPQSTSNETIGLMDLMATCAAIVGDKLPDNAGQDSFNFLPALTGEKYNKPIRETIIHHSGGGVFSIRQGDFKLIKECREAGYDNGPTPGAPGQLYNLAEDPGEQNNLWDEHPDIVERLTHKLNLCRDQGYS
ncbi:MAG: arylsulfatase [Methanosarcinaceae archaeon]|nr:arylsulfatase [Methanosarcinaceae archaeon]